MVDILCLRVATLEKFFEEPVSDEKEAKHRDGLSMYASGLRSGIILTPPSKIKEIEGQLLGLREKSAPLRSINNVHDSEDFSRPLEDLQEVVLDYMVRP